jgi:hypothetical protein
MATTAGTENGLLPLTRGALAVESLLVLAAGFQLYVLTDQTDRFFPWAIQAGPR